MSGFRTRGTHAIRKAAPLVVGGLIGSLVLVPSVAHAAVTITAGSGDVPITQVVLDDDGTIVTQNSSQSGVIDATSDQVDFVSITIDPGSGPIVLDEFNVAGTTTEDFNFPATLTGVSAIENGVFTSVNTAGFEDAVTRVLNSFDIRDYLAYDGINIDGSNWNPDFDMMFSAPMRNDDYLLVMERNGNTFFDLVALDADGNPIAGGEVVGFNSSYRWNTGYAPSDRTGQPMWFTVVDIEAFDVDTYDTPIYGFRIDNDGEADVKFFGLDDDPFLEDMVVDKTVYAGHDGGASCGTAGELASVFTGGDVTFCFTVTNNGEAPLDDLSLTDADVGLTGAGVTDLTVVSGSEPVTAGNSIVLAYETTAASSYVNTVSVSADVLLRGGGVNTVLSPLSDSDTAEVQVTGPAPSSIAGTVVDDQGNPIQGVTITLSGSASDSTTTGADGTYSFTGLAAGTYTVTETQPAGYGDGGETAGTSGGDDSSNDAISGISLGAGVDATDYDFDETTGSIAGTVVDEFGDPIEGVTITLSGDASDTTTTGVDGSYSFDGLLEGTYTVTETQPTGYGDGGEAAGNSGGDDSADDVISGIELGAGVDASGYDFDEVSGSISGTVRDDLGNPIEGVTITLTGTDTDGPVSLTVTTGVDGTYSFDQLAPGTYTVTETQPTGFGDGGETSSDPSAAVADDQISSIEIVAGQNVPDNDFVETTSSIAGNVVDQNGSGIAGVVITLSGTDANGDPVSETTTTGNDGSYSFDGLLEGTYTIVESQPPGFIDGGESAGSTGGTATNDVISEITLGAGVDSIDNDFDEQIDPANTPATTPSATPSATPSPTADPILPTTGTDATTSMVMIAIASLVLGLALTTAGLRPAFRRVGPSRPRNRD